MSTHFQLQTSFLLTKFLQKLYISVCKLYIIAKRYFEAKVSAFRFTILIVRLFEEGTLKRRCPLLGSLYLLYLIKRASLLLGSPFLFSALEEIINLY